MRDVVIVGCGGFGREVHDVIDAINRVEPTWNVLGYLDDAPDHTTVTLVERRGSTVLGPVHEYLSAGSSTTYAIGIGSPQVGKVIDGQFLDQAWEAATLVHPSASLGAEVTIGEGSIICAGVRVTTNVRLGRSVHLNLNVTVGHDTVLNDYAAVIL